MEQRIGPTLVDEVEGAERVDDARWVMRLPHRESTRPGVFPVVIADALREGRWERNRASMIA